jgi:hypothetical protein
VVDQSRHLTRCLTITGNTANLQAFKHSVTQRPQWRSTGSKVIDQFQHITTGTISASTVTASGVLNIRGYLNVKTAIDNL